MTVNQIRRILFWIAALFLATVGVGLDSGAFAQPTAVFVTTVDIPVTNNSLRRFDSMAETFTATIGGQPGFFGTSVLGGNVLVADYNADAIRRFSLAGTALSAFRGFANPTFLETDSHSNVYTTHYSLGPSVATRFDSVGNITQTFTHPAMETLKGIDADAEGNVYIVSGSSESGALFKFAPDGTYLNSIGFYSTASDISIDEAGQKIYVADSTTVPYGIKVIDISVPTPRVTEFIMTPASAYIVGIHFAFDTGHIFATDLGPTSDDPRGLEFSPDGTLLREFRPSNAFLAWDITTLVVPEPNPFAPLSVAACCVYVKLINNRRRRSDWRLNLRALALPPNRTAESCGPASSARCRG